MAASCLQYEERRGLEVEPSLRHSPEKKYIDIILQLEIAVGINCPVSTRVKI